MNNTENPNEIDTPSEIDIQAIRRQLDGKSGQAYWRSLDELAETQEFQEFLEKEFPRQAAPFAGSLDRRAFLKLLGASLALAGLSACARPNLPEDKVVPYVESPEEIIPGKPLFYATAIRRRGYAVGVLAESHQGRPTKLEGNPDHPGSLGATDAITQASVLQLYDPERAQLVTRGGEAATWDDAFAALRDALAASGDGTGVALLTETVTSPTEARLIAQLQESYPNVRWHQYDPLHANGVVEGARLAFGEPVQTVYDFSQAAVVVSFDADFTDRGPGHLRYAREFAARRRVRGAEDDMNRFYAFEITPTPTGSIADHRVRVRPNELAAAIGAIARELGVDAPGEAPAHVDPTLIEAVVEDLRANAGRSVVVVGEEQPAVVHALAHAINDALGSVGTTVRYLEPVEASPVDQVASLRELSAAMAAGEVETLLVLGANPVYTAPADLDFATAMDAVPVSAVASLYRDETAARATWHLPLAHYLETWGDARAFDGTVTILQPLIQPFYGGRSEIEILASLLTDGESARGMEVLQATWRDRVQGSFDEFWRAALYRGVVAGTGAAEASPTLASFPIELPVQEDGGLVVAIRPDPSLEDGRWANNGWLQELPKPFTKLTWDNAALLSPATAVELGVTNHDVLELTVSGRSVLAPVWVLPGQADGVITAHVGFGRSEGGRVGADVGYNAYRLLDSELGAHAPVEARRTGERYRLASTQLHQNLEGTGERRHIIRAGTLQQLREEPEHPHFVHPVDHHDTDLYPDYIYESYAWGMVVDMSVCTGCNACVVACQAENNVPIVGKDQVMVGREMHWLRVDNYYSGSLDDPEYAHQPMMCQHCEKAPCEPVCPVGATVHDHEGLNVMVYNRCVGTRYCSNNCPYKVRRFNYLQYAELADNHTELSLAYNPDVTVRSRGVMEKCTYCTQRISQARIQANNEGRAIGDGEVVTACAAACPTEAIVFGDINDPDADVTRTKRSPLNYALLEELMTQPRTSYLAKVRNPHPLLAGDETGGH